MKRLTALVVASALLGASIGCGSARTSAPRVVVLGFDGLDFALTQELMAEGRLPNLARLAASGGFGPLATSIPPQSPVAWSTFITGLDPGGHGIFDFMHRDPATMTPYLSTTRTQAGDHRLTLGPWQFPLSPGRVELLRRGRSFWEVLEAHGVETSIIKMPANFPPSHRATRELSGMGTPDILGTYGVFSFYTSDSRLLPEGDLNGGVVHYVDASRGVVTGTLEGPPQPYRTEPEAMRASFVAHVDSSRQFVRIVVGREQRVLRVGEWSDWVPVSFDVKPWQTLEAECRFFLKQLEPNFELYASPVNVDPMSPALPVSTPAGFAPDLARELGRYYTQGMPEETKAMKTGVFSTDDFLRQARLVQAENVRQFRYMLREVNRGLLFYYFGNVDQVSHMLWRARDSRHPAYDGDRDAPYAQVIDGLYAEVDGIVGETMSRLAPQDLLVVMSDHGFASWRRSFNLNTWLRNEGYLTPSVRAGRTVLNQIDLSRTRAYGLGLNGLYVNLAGREAFGIVDPARRDTLVNEIRDKLLRAIDPATGLPIVTKVYRRDEVFRTADVDAAAPDLILGYAKGTRVSDESALGGVARAALADNTSAWSGDHCMDPDSVPGVLLTSRTLKARPSSLQALAPAILAELGIDEFPEKTGSK